MFQQHWHLQPSCRSLQKHISLAVRLFSRCGADWLPAPLMWGWSFYCSYLQWLRMEAAKGEILFAGAQRKQASRGEPSQLDIAENGRVSSVSETGMVFAVSCRNQRHWDGIGADVRWRSCTINKGSGEVVSNLATVFLFVILLGKQLASQGGLAIRRRKFKGNSRVMGWKRQQAGGDWVGRGLLLSPAVLSMSFLTVGQSQVTRPPRRKERETRGGSNTG